MLDITVLTDTGQFVEDATQVFDSFWVTFHVPPAVLQALPPSELASLKLFYFDEIAGIWKQDAGNTVVDAVAGTIRAQVLHFSIHAIFSNLAFAAAAVNSSNINVYPNPYRPNDGNPATGVPYRGRGDGSGIYFNGMLSGTKIEIYDVRGRLVYEEMVTAGTGVAQWDVRNKGGDEVASGVYFVVFINGSDKQTRKLIIIR